MQQNAKNPKWRVVILNRKRERVHVLQYTQQLWRTRKKKKRCTEKLSSELIYSLTLSLPETTYLLTSVHFGRLTILPRHPLYVFTVFINILIIANDSIYPFIDSYSCCIKPPPPPFPFVSLTSRPIFLCFDFPHPPFSKSGLLSQKRPIFSEKREKKKWKKKKTVNSAGFPTPFFPPGESHSISSSFLILYRFFVFADPDASERQEEKKVPESDNWRRKRTREEKR